MSKAFAGFFRSGATPFTPRPQIELTCRTDSLAALRAAVDHGANSIRLKSRPRTEIPGIDQHEFQRAGLKKAVRYAFENGCSVCLEMEAHVGGDEMRGLLGRAFDAGIREISVASAAQALYLRVHHPDVGVRYVLGEAELAKRALELLQLRLGVARMVLPRVVSLRQLELLQPPPGTELELQCYGAGCALVIPAGERVPRDDSAVLGDGDGTSLCASLEGASNEGSFSSTEACGGLSPSHLPALLRLGIRGLIIEAPTRSPARVAQLTASWRDAITECQLAHAVPACRLVSGHD